MGDTASGYISQNKAFGTGGYGSIMLTAIVGAASGNVTGSGSALLQNTAINVLRQYGAQQIKGIADGFRPAGASTDDALSGSVRAALHAIAGCAGAAATGGDCTSAAAGSAATVALNNLIVADTTKMTAEQKQAYSNLMGTLVAGVTAGVGGDAAAATLAGKIEVENNYLGRLTANGYNQMIDKQCGGLPTHAQSGCVQGIKDKAIATSDRLNKEMIAACTSDPTGSVCSNARESARWFIDSDVAQSLGMGAGSRAALIKADALVSYAAVAHTVNTRPSIHVSTSVIQATPLTPQQQYLAGVNGAQNINAANPLAMQDMTGAYAADLFLNSLGESFGSLGVLGAPTGSYEATSLTNPYTGAHINPNDARNNVVLDLVTTAAPIGGTRGVKGGVTEGELSFQNSITASGDTVHHSPISTAVGDDLATVNNFNNATNTGNGHNVIVHGQLSYDELGGIPTVNGRETNPAQIAEAVRSNPHYVEGTQVCFGSCWSGSSGSAQQLANELNTPVFAPTRPVAWDSRSNKWVFDSDFSMNVKHPEIKAEWQMYYPTK